MVKAKQSQRNEIKFCVHCNWGCQEVRQCAVTQIHEQNALYASQICHWYAVCAAGGGASGSSSVTRTTKMMYPSNDPASEKCCDLRPMTTVRQVARRTRLSASSAFKVLQSNLELKKKTASWVPHLSTGAQKQVRVTRCGAAFTMLGHGGQGDHVICSDESWFHTRDPDFRHENRQ